MRCEPLDAVYSIDCSPGNGSRYRLVVALQGGCIRAVSWPDSNWSAGDFGPCGVSWEWLAHSARLREPDARAIASILAATPWLSPPVCPECEGSGRCPQCLRIPGDCPECGGEGCDECDDEGVCPECGGTGDCPECQR